MLYSPNQISIYSRVAPIFDLLLVMGKSTKVKLLNSKVDLKPIPIITKIQHHNSPAYPVGSIFKNAQLLSKGESAQINDKTQITPSAGMTDISSIQAQMVILLPFKFTTMLIQSYFF